MLISIKSIQNGEYTISLINSQIDLLRSQTTLIKGNAQFSILEIAKAIPASLKYALTFILRILTSHDEKLLQIMKKVYDMFKKEQNFSIEDTLKHFKG